MIKNYSFKLSKTSNFRADGLSLDFFAPILLAVSELHCIQCMS